MKARAFDLIATEQRAYERAGRLALVIVRRYVLTRYALEALRRKGARP